MSDEEFTCLIQALQENSVITKLNLSFNNVHKLIHMTSLLNSICDLSSLEELNLSYNLSHNSHD